jgi:hypothetical protein
MGRSPRTIAWYEQKMSWYLDHEGGPATLDVLTAFELKRLLASLQERDLAPDTIHGFFQVVRAFGNWADREATRWTRLCCGCVRPTSRQPSTPSSGPRVWR